MKIRQTIHLKLALVVSGAALLVSVFSAWWVYLASYQDTISDGERKIAQLMVAVKQTAAVAAFSGNVPIADDVVVSLTSSDMIRYARITGQNGLDVHAGQSSHIPRRRMVLPAPFSPDDAAGALEVEPDLKLMEERARRDGWKAATILSVQSLIIALIVYLVVFHLLSRPLARMSYQLHDIIPGSSERLPERPARFGDELTRLTGDINMLLRMVQQVVMAERNLRDHVQVLEKRVRGVFESVNVGIVLMDMNGKLLMANPSFKRLLGREVGKTEQGEWIPELFLQPQRLWLCADESRKRHQPVAEDLQTRHGWLHVIVVASQDESGALQYQSMFYDISERKASEDAMRRLADYDHLTGVYSRQAGEQLLQRMMEQAKSTRHMMAVLMIDLDKFKSINDTFGHDAGDLVLMEVARRLRSLLTRDDPLIRLGGDEFMVVLIGPDLPERAYMLASQIVHKIAMPIGLGSTLQGQVGASVGLAFYPEHGDNANDLRCNADRAMYEVKRKGRNGYEVFCDDKPEAAVRDDVPRREWHGEVPVASPAPSSLDLPQD